MSIKFYKAALNKLPLHYRWLTLYAFVLGALLTLAFSPFDLIAVVPISFLGLLYLLGITVNQSAFKKFLIGFCFGFGHFTTSLYWLAYPLTIDADQFAWLIPFSVTIIPALISIFIGLFTAIIGSFIHRNHLLTCFTFSSGWILTEYLRSHAILDFPWNLIGYSSHASIYLMQLVSLIGIYGTGFIIVLASVILYSRRIKWIIGTYAMLCICFIYGYWRIPNDIGDNNDLSIKVRIIQPNLRTFDFKTNVEKYNSLVKLIELSNSSGYENLDLIVWPEASFPFIMAKHEDLIKSPLQLKYISAKVVFNNNYDIMHFLKFIELDNRIVLMNDMSWVAFLQKNIKSKAPLIFGADRYTFSEDQNNYALYNSMFFIHGNEVDFYDKRILVPFGEYVPWKKALPFIHNIVGSAFEFSSGAPRHFATKAIDSYNIMPLICFESIFDSFYSNMYNKSEIFHSLYSNLLGKNATLVLNITNDLWFGDSIGPYHHFTMSLIRSIEYGSSLVRVANSGISAVIDCYGRVLTSCNLNQEVVKDFDVQLHSRKSIYFEYKLMPLVISIITIFFVLNVFLLYKFPNSYKYLI